MHKPPSYRCSLVYIRRLGPVARFPSPPCSTATLGASLGCRYSPPTFSQIIETQAYQECHSNFAFDGLSTNSVNTSSSVCFFLVSITSYLLQDLYSVVTYYTSLQIFNSAMLPTSTAPYQFALHTVLSLRPWLDALSQVLVILEARTCGL